MHTLQPAPVAQPCDREERAEMERGCTAHEVSTKTIQELDREKLEKKFPKKGKESLN